MRYPVVYKGKPLMPCNKRRARALVRSGRAVFVKDKVLGIYVKLKTKPSGTTTQLLTLGVDEGTIFTGFSVVNRQNSFNVEFENTRKIGKNGNTVKDCITKQTENKNMFKRLRRGRLRHREERFDNRTGNKITYTANYYFQNIYNMIKRICGLYPITVVIFEDVAAAHNKEQKNSNFSCIEQGKQRLYKSCKAFADVWISKANPKTIRLYKGNVDLKTADKSEKSFYAHCIDSHSLACIPFGGHLPYDPSVVYVSRRLPNIDKNRRKLQREMTVRGAEERRPSKLRKIREKINEHQGNHGPWTYQYTERETTKSKTVTPYGSSIKISNSHSENCKKGENKYKANGKYEYYDIQHIKAQETPDNISYYLGYALPKEVFKLVIPFGKGTHR